MPNLSAASRRQASGLDAAIARGQHAAMGDVSDLTEDDGTSSPTILNQGTPSASSSGHGLDDSAARPRSNPTTTSTVAALY